MKHIGLFESGFSSLIQSKSTALGLLSTPIVENAALYLFKGKQPNFSDLDLKIQAANSEGIKSFLTSQSDVRIPLVLNTSKTGNNVLLNIAPANHDLSTNKEGLSYFPPQLGTPTFQNLVPVMFSDNQDGYVITASSVYNSSYAAWKAFQRLESSVNEDGWLSSSDILGSSIFDTRPQWIQIEFPAATVVDSYRIRNGANPHMVRGSLVASNDQTNWTVLHNITSNTTSNFTWLNRETFVNTTPYKYYRFNIFQTSESDFVGLGELELTRISGYSGILYGVNNYSIKYGVPTSTPILPLPVKVPVAYESTQTYYEKSILSGVLGIGSHNGVLNTGLLAGELGDLRYSFSGEQRDNLGTALSIRTENAVDANCIVMYITSKDWPRSTTPMKFYVHDDQDVIHEIALTEYPVNAYVKVSFDRKMVKGISVYSRGIESRYTISGMRYCSFNTLTLGLDDVQVNQTDNELDYTAALLVLDEDDSVRVTSHIPPMLVMSISNGTSTDLTILDSKKKIVKARDITMKAILALPLVGN